MELQSPRGAPGCGTNYFTGANHLNIERLEITHIEQPNLGQHPLATNHDPSQPILDASYLRNRKTSPPDSNCLAGTRKEIIRSITSWATESPPTGVQHICWLYGYVGCGKSAIAQTIAEKFADEDRLLASYFFFRGSGDRSRTRRFCSTVVSQMQGCIPAMEPLVQAVVKKHPGVYTFPLDTQFRLLIFEPFRAAITQMVGSNTPTPKNSYLIVIDGVDECDDHDDITVWMHGMVAYLDKHPELPLRFFISSRVQEHIRDSLSSDQVKMVNLVDNCAKADIALVTEESFKAAARLNRVIRSFGPRWPSAEQKRLLVEHTGGSFVFMSALLKYILEPGRDHQKRLALALNLDPGLDGLYADTLSLSEHLPHFSMVISTIALLHRPLSISGLAELLDIPNFEVVQILMNLHAILQVPGDDFDPVTVCHSSLYDFLTTKSRSKKLFVSPSHHKTLFERCFQVILSSASHGLVGSPTTAVQDYAVRNVVRHFEKYWRLLGENNWERKGHIVDALTLAIRNHDSSFLDAAITWIASTHDNYLSLFPSDVDSNAEFSRFFEGISHSLGTSGFRNFGHFQSILMSIHTLHPTAWSHGYNHLISHLRIMEYFASAVIWERRWPAVVIAPFRTGGAWRSHLYRYIRTFWVHHVYKFIDECADSKNSTSILQRIKPLPLSEESRWVEGLSRFTKTPGDEYRRVNDWATLDEELEDMFPTQYARAKSDWRWERRQLGPELWMECHFLGLPRQLILPTLLEVIAGYTQLALCMTYVCQHGSDGGKVCPPKKFRDGRPYPIPEIWEP